MTNNRYLDLAKSVIDNFDLDVNNYHLDTNSDIVVKNTNDTNTVYIKDNKIKAKINIDFFNANSCTVFIGNNILGTIHIKVKNDNSMVYIGNDCDLKKVIIDSNQKNDLIAIGNHIGANINNQWRSGLRAGVGNPAIIIGDDCMFAADVLMRNTDAHPIYSMEKNSQINAPKSLIILEPHVWVGQKVNILKDVQIGACSIIGLGSIVTKDIERFCIAKGIPATGKVDRDLFWSLSMDSDDIKRAKYYTKLYRDIKLRYL